MLAPSWKEGSLVNNEFTVAEYQSDNWLQIRQLFGTVYERNSDKFPSQAELDWRYRNDLFESAIGIAKSRDEQLVALRPIVTKIVKIDNEDHSAAHFMDAMTHPEFRRRGLFTRLMGWGTDIATQRGAAICYAFPNENSFPAYIKRTDWTHVGSIPLFIKPINVDALLKLGVSARPARAVLGPILKSGLSLICRDDGNGRARNVAVRRLKYFDERFDLFWEYAASDYEIILKRDSRYLNWRYLYRPAVEYTAYVAEAAERVLGFIVLRTRLMFGIELGLIVDLLTLNQDQNVARALIAEGTAHLEQVGADAIGCLMFDHQPYCQALRREGFIRVPQRVMPRQFYFLTRINSDEPTLKHALKQENWFLTWGDNDAV